MTAKKNKHRKSRFTRFFDEVIGNEVGCISRARNGAWCRLVCFVVFAIVSPTIATQSANAQSEAKGSWKFANDKPDPIRTNPPSTKIAQGEKSFAKGEAEAVLGKGGPTGAFVWAHWHGIHPDRQGKTKYKVTALVRDEGGYYYMALPLLDQEVEGVGDKKERHRHGYGQFVLPPGDDAEFLKLAVDGDVKLIVEVNGTRENEGFFGTLKEEAQEKVKEFLSGTIGEIDLLKSLNEGKTPQK